MNKKKTLKTILFSLSMVTIGVVVIVNIILFVNPLLRSAERQRSDILRLTPIGMGMEEVLAVVEGRENWRLERVSHTRGFIDYSRIDPEIRIGSGHPTVGVQSIRAYLGQSWALGHHVQASWGFDSDGRLIDVFVRKSLAK